MSTTQVFNIVLCEQHKLVWWVGKKQFFDPKLAKLFLSTTKKHEKKKWEEYLSIPSTKAIFLLELSRVHLRRISQVEYLLLRFLNSAMFIINN